MNIKRNDKQKGRLKGRGELHNCITNLLKARFEPAKFCWEVSIERNISYTKKKLD